MQRFFSFERRRLQISEALLWLKYSLNFEPDTGVSLFFEELRGFVWQFMSVPVKRPV